MSPPQIPPHLQMYNSNTLLSPLSHLQKPSQTMHAAALKDPTKNGPTKASRFIPTEPTRTSHVVDQTTNKMYNYNYASQAPPPAQMYNCMQVPTVTPHPQAVEMAGGASNPPHALKTTPVRNSLSNFAPQTPRTNQIVANPPPAMRTDPMYISASQYPASLQQQNSKRMAVLSENSKTMSIAPFKDSKAVSVEEENAILLKLFDQGDDHSDLKNSPTCTIKPKSPSRRRVLQPHCWKVVQEYVAPPLQSKTTAETSQTPLSYHHIFLQNMSQACSLIFGDKRTAEMHRQYVNDCLHYLGQGAWPHRYSPPPLNVFLPRITDSIGVGKQALDSMDFAKLCVCLWQQGQNTPLLPTTRAKTKEMLRFFLTFHFPGHLWMDEAILSELGILSGKEPCLEFCNWSSKKLYEVLVEEEIWEGEPLPHDFDFFAQCIFWDRKPIFQHNKSGGQFPWNDECSELVAEITKDVMDEFELKQLKSVGLGPKLPSTQQSDGCTHECHKVLQQYYRPVLGAKTVCMEVAPHSASILYGGRGVRTEEMAVFLLETAFDISRNQAQKLIMHDKFNLGRVWKNVRIKSLQPGGAAYEAGIKSNQPGGAAYEARIKSNQPGGAAYEARIKSNQPGGAAYQARIKSNQPGGAAYEARIKSNQLAEPTLSLFGARPGPNGWTYMPNS